MVKWNLTFRKGTLNPWDVNVLIPDSQKEHKECRSSQSLDCEQSFRFEVRVCNAIEPFA